MTGSTSSDLEKDSIRAHEQSRLVPLYNEHIDVSGVDERKLMRKIDIALIPWLSLLYLLSFLDRTSIGNAKLYSLEQDLNITDNQYLLALTVFFFRSSVLRVMRITVNAAKTIGMRWMLGMFEAGLFPGVNYYLSCWYKRSEFGIRAAIFFSAATVSGAFGGLLAAAISNMEGIGGKPAWAWIFIIEGLATVIAGALSFFIVQDFPDTAKFLTEEERTVVVRRLQGDDQFSAAGEELKMKYIYKSILDWKTWVGMIIYVGADMPLYAFSLFLPSIINQVITPGFEATPANLLTVPVYTFACIITCLVGFLADRWGRRGYFNLVFLCLGAAGYIILIASRSAALSYFAVYLATCHCGNFPRNSTNPSPFILSAWVSNNVEGSYKRSVTLAMVISFGNINGAVSSNVYRAKDKPWYPLGKKACLTGLVLLYIGLGLVSSTTFLFLLRRENAKRDRGERNEIIGDNKNGSGLEANGRYNTIADAKKDKGDEWSGYRYTI
ncbi:hypothetical protein GYMLUDRAFT_174358 [Collybiopsis luxurians FD-317 M1]|uniref:Major facilitator superfamily (MFS) profile domain-containing protein n=1 Tax=Collybiopsis luxurians FD-317 M1 TaxID=944289 RepID=A0A0D0CMC3_9AGAR|nr:hypothetical protein GYMLUDRAFT_174358 [Collybiopsis luxurians FD-317 M1]